MTAGSDFLYPFLDAGERDVDALLADLEASAVAKIDESRSLRDRTVERLGPELTMMAEATAARFDGGGALYAFGNGGSATDAAGLAALFAEPPSGRPVPARCLAADEAVLTALANDVGFDLVFARQLIAFAAPGDIAVGLSTSGDSENLLVAFREAKARGMLTVALVGGSGGRCRGSQEVDHCLVVESDSVHRIQEAQAAVVAEWWRLVQALLGAVVREPEGHA